MIIWLENSKKDEIQEKHESTVLFGAFYLFAKRTSVRMY
jgi:hypothetical protein